MQWPVEWSQDGVLGLSWGIPNNRGMSPTSILPLFVVLRYTTAAPQQNAFIEKLNLTSPVFGMEFERLPDDGGRVNMDIGTINSNKTAVSYITAPVKSNGGKTWTLSDISFIIGDSKSRFRLNASQPVYQQSMNFGRSHFLYCLAPSSSKLTLYNRYGLRAEDVCRRAGHESLLCQRSQQNPQLRGQYLQISLRLPAP